jgi:iron complex outermembrane receptor protein
MTHLSLIALCGKISRHHTVVGSGRADPVSAAIRHTLLRSSRKPIIAVALCQVVLGLAAPDVGRAATVQAQDDQTLQEVVVTAERREQTLDKVPESLTALSQKTMDDLHIQSFSDLATIVPGLVLAPPQVYTQAQTDVAIRGIYSNGNAPTTGIYIDETPIEIRRMDNAAISGSPQPDIFDLERIEVLRGPQGTLFGSSAMGGAIRYITPQPSLDETSGYAKAEYGYTDRGAPSYAVGVAYGAPVVEGVAGFRMSGWFHSDGGFLDVEDPYTGNIVKRNVNSDHAYTLRPAFTVAPTDGLTITPAVFIQQQHSDGPSIYWASLLPKPEDGAPVSGNLAPQPYNDRLTVPSLAIKYNFNGMVLQSDTSFVHRDYLDYDDWTNLEPVLLGGAPVNPSLSGYSFRDSNIDFTRASQQEFRLTSSDPNARVTWVAGAYYRHALEGASQLAGPGLSPITELIAGQTSQQFFGVPNYVANGQTLAGYTFFTTVDQQTAVFGQISINILPHLKAEFGVRVEHAVVEQQNETYAGPLNGAAFATQTLPDQVQNPVTPRFSLSYQYTDEDMIYLTAAKGYRAGGSNALNASTDVLCEPSLRALGLTSVPEQYRSDGLWSYEVGAKDSFFERRLALQASAYFIDWPGIQTSFALPSCGLGFFTNSGKAISKGFDLQLAAVPLDGLKLSLNVGYTDAYYPNASFGAPTNGVVPLLIGAGDKLADVLPWTVATTAEYQWDISRLWSGARSYFRADYRWLDAAPKADPNVVGYDSQTGPYPNQAYGMLNLRLGVLHQGLDLSAFVNNATRANPLIGYNNIFYGNPLFEAAAIRPLTVGLTALYRF